MIAEEMLRRRCRSNFGAYCAYALHRFGQEPAAHHWLIIEALQEVFDGITDRLLIQLPPGSAKSTYGSKLFPAFYLTKGRKDIIAASYNSKLAEDFSQDVQRFVLEDQDVLGYRPTSDAKELWRTSLGGVYRAAGAGSGITGRRADLFLIDDPIKGRAEADSATTRERVWNWYRAEVIPRLKPGAAIVLIQTRWHPDDLAGRLLQEQENGGDRWKVLDLPALARGPDPDGNPRPDPLGRKPGEALWPGWEDEEAIARKRRAIGEIEFSCLYQQEPLVSSGLLFQPEKIEVVEVEPPCDAKGRGWDLAATSQVGSRDPDWTVGLKLGRLRDGRFCILDMVRLRGGPQDVEAAIVNTSNADKFPCAVGLPQDPGQAGKAQIAYLVGRLKGHKVITSPESGSKETRAAPVASQVNVGNFLMVKAPWNSVLIEELRYFPHGAKKDIVDALSRAFSLLDNPKGDIWMRLAQKGRPPQ